MKTIAKTSNLFPLPLFASLSIVLLDILGYSKTALASRLRLLGRARKSRGLPLIPAGFCEWEAFALWKVRAMRNGAAIKLN
jgi:hypothetical protein